ncbi:hypothetical protein [Shimazuella alba]|uniref:Uncharacterized protein n=1 Tax=Shimazuella alba TaxID=2690964 RepID=A0A6I4VSV4_9BACL|nr:hypothetical protein [Shimazuella alba]MXQ54657.1 hypothetical protein [Shimazuella alba]
MSMEMVLLSGILIVIFVYGVIITVVSLYAKASGKDAKSTIIMLVVLLIVFLLGMVYIYGNYKHRIS